MLCVNLYHGDLYSDLWKVTRVLGRPLFSVGRDQVGTIHQRIMPSKNNDRGLDLAPTGITVGKIGQTHDLQ